MTRKCGAIVFLVCMLAFLSRRKEKKGRKIDRNLFEFNQYYCKFLGVSTALAF